MQYLFGVMRNKLQSTAASETFNTKHLELKSKEDQKVKKRICHVNML